MKNKGNLILSKKHGINPTISVCFFCGKSKGVAHMGKIDEEDSEAPKSACFDYEPCECCKAKMNEGFTLLEAQDTPCSEGQPPITVKGQGEMYLTSRYLVLTAKEDTALQKGGVSVSKKADFEDILKKYEVPGYTDI